MLWEELFQSLSEEVSESDFREFWAGAMLFFGN